MKAWQRWTFDASATVVSASGTAYGWMKYLMRTDDPFAVVNHPWQPAMLHSHVLAAPVLLVAFGTLLGSHITRKLRSGDRPNRMSGLILTTMFAAMAVSAYALQVVTNEMWQLSLVWVHVVGGAVFVVAYIVHLLVSRTLPHPPGSNGCGNGNGNGNGR